MRSKKQKEQTRNASISKKKKFYILNSTEDRILTIIHLERKSGERSRVKEFEISYETWYKEKWRSVILYHSPHKKHNPQIHYHTYFLPSRRTTIVFSNQDIETAFQEAYNQIKEKWEIFKMRFLGKRSS